VPQRPVNTALPQPPSLWRGPGLSRVSGVVHGFTGRDGGVSTGSLSSLNLARRPGESAERLEENWARAVDALGGGLAAADVALVHQVHGAEVVEVSSAPGPLTPVGRADALVSAARGVVLAIRIADCVPVLLASPGAVAAAHAGWRGTAAGVVPAAVHALREVGGSGPVVAAIGPSIAGRDYEVGPEVVEALVAAGGDPAAFVVGTSDAGRPLVDVATVVSGQLHALGVDVVDRHDGSTFADRGYWSHRRDGQGAGRQAALIARVAP